MIRFCCPRCKTLLQVADELACNTVACSRCGQALRAPSAQVGSQDKSWWQGAVSQPAPSPVPPPSPPRPPAEPPPAPPSVRKHGAQKQTPSRPSRTPRSQAAAPPSLPAGRRAEPPGQSKGRGGLLILLLLVGAGIFLVSAA